MKKFLLIFLVSFLNFNSCFAMMPSHVYSDRIAGSGFKAIVVVRKIVPLMDKKYDRSLVAVFEIEKEIPITWEISEEGRKNKFSITKKRAPSQVLRKKQKYTKTQSANDICIAPRPLLQRPRKNTLPDGVTEEKLKNKKEKINKLKKEMKDNQTLGFFYNAIVHRLGGSPIYFHPIVGQRAFVTMYGKNSSITSYTKMTPELEEILINNHQAVRPAAGRIHF